MKPFDFLSPTRVLFGEGTFDLLGTVAAEMGFRRALLVADRGLRAAGFADSAVRGLEKSGVAVWAFHEFEANPDDTMVEAGRAFAAPLGIDSIIGLGGGSSMDCAKAINFLLTNGGAIQDYWGYAKASRPMLPMIGIPTTTGTGSEAQSYALISDARTHAKMACGDSKATFRVAILDPKLALTQPASVRAAAGYDAISHAVETWVTTKRNAISECFARQAWILLSGAFERFLSHPDDLDATGAMQVGAYLAGAAIENSMLGATHACANPLTTRYGITHGIAIALMLGPVVRWNAAAANGRYSELASDLPGLLRAFAVSAGLPTRLRDAGVPRDELSSLAQDAVTQWTGRFNPRPFDAAGALEVYECAY